MVGAGDMMRRRLVLLAAAGAAVAGLAVVPPAAEPVQAAPTELSDPTARPLGAVTVIGDSVMLGGLIVSPTIVDRLAERGWGPIRARAGEGYRTGYIDSAATSKASYWIERWRGEGWDAPNVIVNLGANDMGFCRADDPECSYRSVKYLVDVIGPGHRIWWPKATRAANLSVQQGNWNRALDRVAAEHDHVTIWDWPTVMADGPFPSPDATHLSGDGYRLRSELMAEQFTADLAVGRRTGVGAVLPEPGTDPTALVPIGPVRVLDTRSDEPGRLAAGSTIEVTVAEHVPDDAVAIAAYVTATATADRGYLTVFDCAEPRPTASVVSYERGGTRGSVAIAPLSPDGSVCVFSRSAADIVVDLQAAFAPDSADGVRFDPLATPRRLLDTRDGGRAELHRVSVPVGAAAAVVSVAAIGRGERGFATAFACDDPRPATASVNHGAVEIVNSMAFVPIGPSGELCIFVKADADITVDLAGVFTPDGSLGFVPVRPTRTIDTRNGTGGWAPVHGRRQTIDAPVAPATARAVSGTLTIVEPVDAGHLRAWPCGDLPPTANVNAAVGQVLANAVTVAVDDAGLLCVFARSATTTVFDTTGWWVDAIRPGE